MRQKRLRATLVGISAAAAVAILPGCVNGKDYYVQAGSGGVYVHIREGSTYAIMAGLLPQCHYNRYCVASKLHDLDSNPRWKAATSRGEANDMWLDAIEPSFWDHSRCPTVRFTPTWAIDWQTHGCHW